VLDGRINELCTRIDDIKSDNGNRLAQLQATFNKDVIDILSDLAQQQQRFDESHKNTTNAQRAFQDTPKAMSHRVSLIEGQGARLLPW